MVHKFTSPDIFLSHRFQKNYKRGSPKFQLYVDGVIHDFVRSYRSNSSTVWRNYDKLAHCKEHILELKIAGAERLLAHFNDNKLILLDCGDHDVVQRYSDKKYYLDAVITYPATPNFWPEKRSTLIINNAEGLCEPKFIQELSEDWVYFLDTEQEEAVLKIVDWVGKFESSSTLLLGGPGTGKTCVLLNLLKWFTDEEYNTGISISSKLLEYIKNSTGIDLSQFIDSPFNKLDFEIMLIDDPSKGSLESFLKSRKERQIKHLVAAFDPLQLDEPITDEYIREIKKLYGANLFFLNGCYRQKENVGKAAKQIFDSVAESSPFLAKEKKENHRREREIITKISNEIKFKNPQGYTFNYEKAMVDDVRKEVRRILGQKHLMWRHTPGLLILLDGCELSVEAKNEIYPLEKLGYVKTMNFSKANEVKGLEYQHVFMFIHEDKYRELVQGFEGTGKAEYERRRLLRIPFSRAKDSLVVFVINTD